MNLTKEFIKEHLLSKAGNLLPQKTRLITPTVSTEQLYQTYHELSAPAKCICGNPCQFISFSKGYRTFCSAKCAANSKTTINKRNATNIEKFGFASPIKNEKVKAKSKEKSLRTHGVEHVATLDSVKQKRKNTNLERYGVECTYQSPELREKGIKTNLQKYGVPYPTQSNTINYRAKKNRKEKWLYQKLNKLSNIVLPKFDINCYNNIDELMEWECSNCQTEFSSRLSDGRIPRCPVCFPYGYNSSANESHLSELIKNMGFNVITNSRSIIPPLELDIYIPEKNLAIEYNGNYWHSELNGKPRNYHVTKTELCAENNIRLIHIMDSEYNNNPQLVESRIRNILGNSEKIYARNCSIAELDYNTCNEFLDVHHIQKRAVSSVRVGLFRDHLLVAVMTFAKSRYTTKTEWELVRYCGMMNYTVVGGASKLFAYFIRHYSPNSIVSYSDKRWNTGKLYKTLGFIHMHDSPPNYVYTKDYVAVYSRLLFQKHKLPTILEKFDPLLSEWENMTANGYDRIWDCGNSVWKWQPES